MEKPIRRNPRNTKKSLNAKQLTFLAGCVIGAAALIVAACFLIFRPIIIDDSDPAPKATQPVEPQEEFGELTILDIYREGASMMVKTSYLDVAYPYAFSDVMFVKTINIDGVAALEFRSQTSTMDEWLYTVWFGGNSGELIGTYGGAVTVTVDFATMPESLSEDDRETFKATQETFNDVLQSLQKSDKFTR